MFVPEINNAFHSYESIKNWKLHQIPHHLIDSTTLNHFHDKVMKKVFDLALIRLGKGKAPCPYTWFITGSGGRMEQGIISDQDHGLIFDHSIADSKEFFLALGEEVSYGLNIVGYPYCEGKVMSSNPLWCKSLADWKIQLFQWMEEESWSSIRYLQIFYDGRRLIGNDHFISILKNFIHKYQKAHPRLMKRMMENVMHVKNAIGPLGQIIVEEKGLHTGSIDLKYSAFLPYVNAVRILSIKEGILETTTIDRINRLLELPKYHHELTDYKLNFQRLLQYRLALFQQDDTYTDTHYLNIKHFSKEEKKVIKKILKDGKKLHHYVSGIIEKGVM